MDTASTPTLRQIKDQLEADLAAIDAQLAEQLGDMDEAAVMALPFPEFMARQVLRVQAVKAKEDLIADALCRGAAISAGSK